MRVLTSQIPLSSERAFEIHRQLNEQSEQLFFRAGLIAVICLSIKYLGLELSELDVPGAKVVISNPRIITGALGWFTIFFVGASAVKLREAMPYLKFCRHHLAATKLDLSPEVGPLSSALSIIYAILLICLIATVVLTLVTVWSDMTYIVRTTIGRVAGWDLFIGPFDTCITR